MYVFCLFFLSKIPPKASLYKSIALSVPNSFTFVHNSFFILNTD